MFTIVPFPAFWISGAAAWITRKVPVRFTATVRENPSAVVSTIPVSARIPAALMTPSSPPIASAALLTAALTEAGSDTSQAIATAPISLATAFAALSDRSRIATAAPSRRNSRAVARPMPDAPPVMMILRPASRAIVVFLFDLVRPLSPANIQESGVFHSDAITVRWQRASEPVPVGRFGSSIAISASPSSARVGLSASSGGVPLGGERQERFFGPQPSHEERYGYAWSAPAGTQHFILRGTESSQTRRWREMDSNHRYPANLAAPSIPAVS